MLAFTINAAVGPITMILGGFLTDRGLAKWTITFGGLLFALGFFLTGFVESPGMPLSNLWCAFRSWSRICLFCLLK